MAVADAWPLQTAVYAAVNSAVSGEAIPVFDHVPVNPPMEFVRIEGVSMADLSLKNKERGRHSFMLGYYLRPTGEAATYVGLQRVWAIINMMHDQVKTLRVNGEPVHLEYMDAESNNDGSSQHGMIRYTIVL